MGNTLETSLVDKWDEETKDEKLNDIRVDITEFRSNKRMALISLGLCRPVRGSAEATVKILRLKGNKLIYEDKIPLTAQYLQKTCIVNLSKEAIIEAGYIYQIKIIYDGSGNYTYSSMIDIYKKDDHSIEFKKGANDTSGENEELKTNLLTDLSFKISEGKDRGCL